MPDPKKRNNQKDTQDEKLMYREMQQMDSGTWPESRVCYLLCVSPVGGTELKTISAPNSENLSTKVEERENSFIVEYALIRNVSSIIDNGLREGRGRKKSHPFTQPSRYHHSVHVLSVNNTSAQ